MDATQRVSRMRDRLAQEGFDAFVATSTSNISWLTGLEQVFDHEQAHVAVVTPDRAVLFTDSRYVTAAREGAAGTGWEVVLELTGRAAAVSTLLEESGARRIAAEDTLSIADWRTYEAAVGSGLETTSSFVETLRAVKDDEEIEAISQAQAITDAAFSHMVGFIVPGMSEREIALELECWMRKNGSDGVAFTSIVAGGPNSALPHATPGDRPVSDGDFIVVDFGARVRGYCSDMTRTVVMGTATDRHREIYDTVLAANRAGIAACRAGVAGKEVDAAARQVIDDAGFGEYFQHGLGHGVGLDIHELPNCGSKSEPVLPARSVVTIEPGIYLPGFGGVRIEDLVVVEDGGCRVLTTSTKDLLEL